MHDMYREKPWVLIAALVGLAICLLYFCTGCVCVRESDAQLIRSHRLNAEAIASKVAADTTLPAWVARWWTAEAQTWKYLDAWAHGEEPPAAPHADTPASTPSQ